MVLESRCACAVVLVDQLVLSHAEKAADQQVRKISAQPGKAAHLDHPDTRWVQAELLFTINI